MSIMYHQQLHYQEYTSDALQFKTTAEADKFVEQNGLRNHEIIAVSIATGDYRKLLQYNEEKKIYFTKGQYYVMPGDQV